MGVGRGVWKYNQHIQYFALTLNLPGKIMLFSKKKRLGLTQFKLILFSFALRNLYVQIIKITFQYLYGTFENNVC